MFLHLHNSFFSFFNLIQSRLWGKYYTRQVIYDWTTENIHISHRYVSNQVLRKKVLKFIYRWCRRVSKNLVRFSKRQSARQQQTGKQRKVAYNNSPVSTHNKYGNRSYRKSNRQFLTLNVFINTVQGVIIKSINTNLRLACVLLIHFYGFFSLLCFIYFVEVIKYYLNDKNVY